MEGTLQEARNLEHILTFLCSAPGAAEEVSCLKMGKVKDLHCGCHGTMEHTKQQKDRWKKEAEPLEAHTCEQQGFIAPSSHQVKQDRDVPTLGRGEFMPVGPAPSKWWIVTTRLNNCLSCSSEKYHLADLSWKIAKPYLWMHVLLRSDYVQRINRKQFWF